VICDCRFAILKASKKIIKFQKSKIPSLFNPVILSFFLIFNYPVNPAYGPGRLFYRIGVIPSNFVFSLFSNKKLIFKGILIQYHTFYYIRLQLYWRL